MYKDQSWHRGLLTFSHLRDFFVQLPCSWSRLKLIIPLQQIPLMHDHLKSGIIWMTEGSPHQKTLRLRHAPQDHRAACCFSVGEGF